MRRGSRLLTLERHPNRMFLDPGQDTPSKLIYALLGYLAWTDDAYVYREELLELRYMLDYTFDIIEAGEEGREKERAAREKERDAKEDC